MDATSLLKEDTWKCEKKDNWSRSQFLKSCKKLIVQGILQSKFAFDFIFSKWLNWNLIAKSEDGEV